MNKYNNKNNMTPEDRFAASLKDRCKHCSPDELDLLVSGLTNLKKERPKWLNHIELETVQTMISFVSYTQKVAQGAVQALLLTQFEAEDVKTLSSKQYHEIMEYLVDLDVKVTS